MEQPTIEKGIPMPEKRDRNRMSGIKWKSLIQTMEIGDSIEVTLRQSQQFKQQLSVHFGQSSYISRDTDNGKVRVWRIK